MPDLVVNPNSPPRTIYLKDYQPPVFFIEEITLKIELFESETLVTSQLKIKRNPYNAHSSQELILNGEELSLKSIYLDNEPLDKSQYQITPNFLIIPTVLDAFTLETCVTIFPQKNTLLSGLYCSNGTFCTQCEAEGFRRITYFLDHPDVLSRFTTTIYADEIKYPYLLSNGNCIASGKSNNNRHWVTYQDPFKKPSYLFALVAGDFDVKQDTFITQSGRTIDLHIYVEKGQLDQVDHAMYSLKEAMSWDEVTYGREYDLDNYKIVAINDFNMGAMENKGLNIFNTRYILAKPETATDKDYIHILSVIGHEYFHNWSGNRVTCRDWFQLSLKEGLTIFRDQSFSADILSQTVMRIHDVHQLRETQFPEDAGPLAHPVRPDSYIEINNFYTATVYNKGAEVLRMLQTLLGKETFRAGMDVYFARFDGQAVTIEDFIEVMEEVSSKDLEQFRLWYCQAGTPNVTVTDDFDGALGIYTLSFSQSIPPTPKQVEKKPMVIPIKMGLLNKNGEALPLVINGKEVGKETVLSLTETSQTVQFKNLKEHPVPSLLRNFSAPIKLNYPYSDKDYLFLFKHDTDFFNRWESGQKYFLRVLLDLIRDYQQGNTLVLEPEISSCFGEVLESSNIEDKLLLAEMISLPTEKYIGEHMEIIDVDAIHTVREFLLTELSERLRSAFFDTYWRHHDKDQPYTFAMQAVGRRQLKNKCLLYLMQHAKNADLAVQQFESSLSKNMSDTEPALIALSHLPIPYREQALQRFYDYWKNDTLVVDKWFAIQAASKLPDTLHQVKKLMRHEAFNIKNPNKVYALVGTFGYQNPVNFHYKNGEGYAFVRETVQKLDTLNPQVAARMVRPLIRWKRYDQERQSLMREQLDLLLQNSNISPDLYEVVSKSIETS